MAKQGHGITYNVDELTGQAQVRFRFLVVLLLREFTWVLIQCTSVYSSLQARQDGFLIQCEEGYQSSTQDSSYTAPASSFLLHAILPPTSLFFTGEQVKSMAHGAAEAVKNTLGMNTENTPTKNTCNDDPSHPSTRA
ncbi:hypothetical protein SADUNF_Sadunf03G0036700 [Salix dunnii]|uniref:Uncharacterized protein n=1 Tax=Salix dunnii TaxID=1413687 RepID=A0A835N1N5_9ROSI|nr:hypothetical protein SADUNF_Sadunf03G0036700 [Salix dunnii]